MPLDSDYRSIILGARGAAAHFASFSRRSNGYVLRMNILMLLRKRKLMKRTLLNMARHLHGAKENRWKNWSSRSASNKSYGITNNAWRVCALNYREIHYVPILNLWI